MGILHQTMYSMMICYTSISMGIFFAWPSSTTKMFESVTGPLHRPMNPWEIYFFGSLSSFGAVVGTMIAGALFDVIGRKACAVLCSLCYVIAWVLMVVCNRVEVMLLAMFISGLGCAAMMVVRLYVSEICQESIRGTMTTGSLIFCSFGILLSYAMGGWTSYNTMLYTYLAIALVGLVPTLVLKESPTFLMKKGREEEAAKSVAFFRHQNVDSKEVQREMDNLRRAFNPDFGDGEAAAAIPEAEKLNPMIVEDKRKLSFWQFMKKSRATRCALVVVLSLVTLGTFQGFTVFQVYAKPLFKAAVPSLPTTIFIIIQAVITLVVAILSGYLSDVCGRRPLLIYASLATAAVCIVLGSQIQFKWAPQWFTVVFLYLYSVTYTFGAGTVPYVLVTDVFLPEVKSYVSTLLIEWSWLSCFVIIFIFPPLEEILKLGNMFYLLAAICVATAVFTFFFLPETKGLPVDVVQKLFSGRRRARGGEIL